MGNKTQRTLIIMGYIYNPDGFDWMNYQISKENPVSYHHIVEKRRNGTTTVENGAILTDKSHDLLNILDQFCPQAYNDLQDVFIRINNSNEPPTNETVKEIDSILFNIFFTSKYYFREGSCEFDRDKLLSRHRERYLKSRKKLTKCLE